MRVSKKRWGEVTIKKQGAGKNRFDKTKSFSIDDVPKNYSIEEYWQILKITTDLTEKFDFETLKKGLIIYAKKRAK